MTDGGRGGRRGKTGLKDFEVETLCSLKLMTVKSARIFPQSLYLVVVLDHHFSDQTVFLKYLI